MNDNAKTWLKELRSGKFKQGLGALVWNEGEQPEYCCLGVACKLYAEDTGLLADLGHCFFSPEQNRGYQIYLPEEVRRWLGLATPSGKFDWLDNSVQLKAEELSGDDLSFDSLVDLNDAAKWTFDQIADFIESEPVGLFE
jgi:hypothetical protein